MDLISGENFQSLADISFYTESNCIIDDQLKSKPQNAFKISEYKPGIYLPKKIFIYTHFVKDFYNKFKDNLHPTTILITHNSDDSINESFKYIADDSRIEKWYCQNRTFSHPKLISIPIGIANSQWPHGRQDILLALSNFGNMRQNLVYKNFSLGTNPAKRSYIDLVTSNNGIPMDLNRSNFEYLQQIRNSAFVISPPGNGIDCHRIWECIALGTIPVVEYHECFSQWKNFPILFVDNWNIVTPDWLMKHYGKIYNAPQVHKMKYWSDIINYEPNYDD